MTKEILASGSYYNKKYYYNEKFEKLPTQIKKDIKDICLRYVNAFKCILLIGFYEDGEVFLETQVLEENEFSFMEIDSKLAIKKIEDEYVDLFEGLAKWYVINGVRK